MVVTSSKSNIGHCEGGRGVYPNWVGVKSSDEEGHMNL